MGKLTWTSSLEEFLGKRSQATIDKLNSAHVYNLYDLLWIFPLRVIELPPLQSFDFFELDKYFHGRAKVLNVQARPNFKLKGKGKALLYNIQVYVKDIYSDQFLQLTWFNAYGSVKDKISKAQFIEFTGKPQIYKSKWQISNPEFHLIADENAPSQLSQAEQDVKIQYPTIKGISGIQIKKIIDKIPNELWNSIEESLPQKILAQRSFLSLAHSFQVIHAKIRPNQELEMKTKERLIYEEFFEGQLKLYLRRKFLKRPVAHKFTVTEADFKSIKAIFPFPLTTDQENAVCEIVKDLNSGHPMMRLVQGDVGCGKTWVAFFAACVILISKKQVSMMCPTEALAIQHFHEAKKLLENSGFKCALILGSTPAKEKKVLLEGVQEGSIQFIIGTHSLIQEKIEFKNLQLAIIDEQHKFGVDQRIKLTSKGEAVHCLIMSATPIPRSLSLTHYGDLDITTIKTMPSGRKGHKTKIVNEENFAKFLSFIKTRLELDEQVYVVVPAINQDEQNEFHNLQEVLINFQKYFPAYRVFPLHGQMKPKEKSDAFLKFNNKEIDILISTSVIEVGVNVPNATIMAIINPERFGLSSLHQLRGRVGRGERPGFCFLVTDQSISQVAMQRLKVIEENTDGFKIAEEDLRLRGEGDLFGTNQSGSESSLRFANIVQHAHILEVAKIDADHLISEKNPEVVSLLEKFSKDERVFTTV